jgi:ribonuclease HIII
MPDIITQVVIKMVSSITFIRPADLALRELKTSCTEVGVTLVREEEVNNGSGVKLYGMVNNQLVAVLLYYNRNRGVSSKIVFEKMPQDSKALLIRKLSSQSSSSKAIPNDARIAVAQRGVATRTSSADLGQDGYIGTDESGKGDYFGPLVVAGVFMEQVNEKRLANAGIRDSKMISDNRIHDLAKMIRSYLDRKQYSVVVIRPEKYNELYAKIGNLNRLLAWAHARSIENILVVVDCKRAIADQFGDESYINKALLEKGKGIELLQMPKAEEHIAVAAASILAREEFLVRLAELNKEFGMEFPKGASAETENAARRFIKKYGMSQLAKCAKLHFKTTDRLRRS